MFVFASLVASSSIYSFYLCCQNSSGLVVALLKNDSKLDDKPEERVAVYVTITKGKNKTEKRVEFGRPLHCLLCTLPSLYIGIDVK